MDLIFNLNFSPACNVGDEGGFAPNIQDNAEGKNVTCSKCQHYLLQKQNFLS